MWLLRRKHGRWIGVYRNADSGGGSGGGAGGSDDGNNGSGNQNNAGGGSNGSNNANNGNGGGSGGSNTNNQGGNNQPETFSREYVKELRDENANHRTRANSLESENNQLKGKLGELEGQVRMLTVGSSVKDALRGAGAVDPDIILQAGIIDLSKVELDAAGKPLTDKLTASIDAVKKERPALFNEKSKNADAGAGGGTTGSSFNDNLRRAAGRA